MKKLLLLTALALGSLGLRAQTLEGSSTLQFTFGLLADSGGTTLNDGILVQIIAAYHGTALTSPTPTDFFGGSTDATILWQGNLDSTTTGIAGSMVVTLADVNIYTSDTLGSYLRAGESVFVRWYPGLTTADTVPGVTSFGQYGYTSISGAVLDTSWVLPAGGATGDFGFLTSSSTAGSLDNSLGFASSSTSAVPEPSTTAALLGLAALGLCWSARRRALSRI